MFGQNEIVGRKFFEEEDRLLVTSIFYTLQGEGPFAGRPAVFVRLAMCNLQCSFCDTNFSHGDWMNRSQVFDAIDDILDKVPSLDTRDIVLVITGGEPMLQPALEMFLLAACSGFGAVQIESNGLQLLNISDRCHLVVSPKCSQASGVPIHYLKPPKRVLSRANCLKFVVAADKDSPYHEVPDWALLWKADTKKPIYVSPMAEYTRQPDLSYLSNAADLGRRSLAERVSFWERDLLDKAKVRANHEHAAKLCLDHGLFLSMQMQLFASLP